MTGYEKVKDKIIDALLEYQGGCPACVGLQNSKGSDCNLNNCRKCWQKALESEVQE